MRDPERIDRIIEILRAKWKTYPDQRLGQLLLNHERDNLFMLEDDELERRLKRPGFNE